MDTKTRIELMADIENKLNAIIELLIKAKLDASEVLDAEPRLINLLDFIDQVNAGVQVTLVDLETIIKKIYE